MSAKLFVYFLDNHLSEINAILVDAAHPQGITLQSSLNDLADYANTHQIILLVDSRHLLLTRVTLPKIAHHRLAQATLYELEDQLLDSVENFHCALGNTDKSHHETAVAIIQQTYLAQLLNALQSVNIVPEKIIPNVLLLPWAANHWTLYFEDEQVMVRTALQQGFVTNTANLKELLKLTLASTAHPPTTLYLINYNSVPPEHASDSQKSLHPPSSSEDFLHIFESTGHVTESRSWESIVTSASLTQPINLQQGKFKADLWSHRTFNHWRIAIYATLGFIFISMLATIAQYFYFAPAHQAITRKLTQHYQVLFPNQPLPEHLITSLSQVIEHFQQHQQNPSFINLLNKVAPTISQAKSIELHKISYQNNLLTLTIKAKKSSDLANLKSTLSHEGLSVTIKESNPNYLTELIIQ